MKQISKLNFLILFFGLWQPAFASPAAGKVSSQSQAEVVSASAGSVAGQVMTLRDILLNSLLEDILYRKKHSELSLKNYKNKNFNREAAAVLLEQAIWLESKGFPVATTTEAQFRQAKKQVLAASKKAPYARVWKSLAPTDSELTEELRQKLSAKKLLAFKVDSAKVPVSDDEAQSYYKNNKFKFEKLPFENFRDNIKDFLSQRQVEDRLKEWFEVLRLKYRIDNQLLVDNS